METKVSDAGRLGLIRHERQDYHESITEQEQLVAQILCGKSTPCLIFTEHPPVFTIGTSGSELDVLHTQIDGEDIAVFKSGRGGEVTYHGPGQLLCYVLVDLRQEQDLHRHVWCLEELMIRGLKAFGLSGERDARGIGIWVKGKKIAAIGVRCRRWITYHGVALNINPNLRHFSGIVPCGMSDAPVTSMQSLGVNAGRVEVEAELEICARKLFGRPG